MPKVHKDTIKESVDTTSAKLGEITASWTHANIGDFSDWFKLMKHSMRLIELNGDASKLSGINKAEIATSSVVNIARSFYEEYTDTLGQEAIEKLKKGKLKVVVVIMENPDILNASSGFLKSILSVIDVDGDGEISAKECRDACFCGCL